MLSHLALFAQQAADGADDIDLMVAANAGIAVAIVALSIAGGLMLAKALRMSDYGWKIALILFALVAGIVVTWRGWPPKLGIDLSGGVILVYEVDQEKKEDKSRSVDMEKLMAAVSKRVNPSGAKEITIRPYGVEQIEIIIPEVDEDEVRRIEKIITNIGSLEFRILANRHDHADLIERALANKSTAIKEVKGPDGRPQARWVPIVNKIDVINSFVNNPSYAVRDLGPDPKGNPRVEILVVLDKFNVTGSYLTQAMPGEAQGSPAVDFAFNARGAALFGGLTASNRPDPATGRERQLGIILDDYLQSAPNIRETITERGQITGKFSKEEVQDLVGVLNAGALPTALRKEPSTRLLTGPTLGEDTIKQAKVATAASMMVVVAFMIIYYRAAGVIASLTLVLNLLLTVALMILIKAAFTLTGVAGLALTLGMSVDANVLIYERMREEFAKGATLRMAIRNGFSRATTTIIDSNLTTLITAVVLYVLGTDQIKGFAVTLTLGLLASLFTAIFVSRVLLDILERKRWLTELKMMQFIGFTNIDFIGAWRICAAASVVLIVIGMTAVGVRGRGLLDIDFTGGTSIQLPFTEPQDIGQIRKSLDELPAEVKQAAVEHIRATQADEIRKEVVKELGDGADPQQVSQRVEERIQQLADLPDHTVKAVRLPDEAPNVRFDINTSNPSIAAVETILKELFKGKLAHNSMTYDKLAMVEASPTTPANGAAPPANGAAPPASTSGENKSEKSGDKSDGNATPPGCEIPEDQEQAAEAAQEQPATEKSSKPADAQEKPADKPTPSAADASATQPSSTQPSSPSPTPSPFPRPAGPSAQPEPNEKSGTTSAAAQASAQEDPYAGGSKATLTFAEAIRHDNLEAKVRLAMDKTQHPAAFVLSNPEHVAGGKTPYKTWEIKVALPTAEAEEVFKAIQHDLDETPVFPQSSNIGGKVAGSTRLQALYALLASLVLIVAYIWVRFEKVMFGLAAVVALLHDVLISLGLVAVSLWLSPVLGFLQVDAFKVDLNIVAALLTIVGYSLNDTIVVFDRIREVRGKSPHITKEMLNLSVNQTLSRTLLTGLTTMFVLVILYFWGGQGIHGFAYCLLGGMIVGTYSSVYVAAPILLWLMKPAQATPAPRSTQEAARVA